MTSNVGARSIVEQKSIGFSNNENKTKNYEQIKSNVMSELKKEFRPEFLNRIDEIIVFKQLEENEIEEIVDLMIKSSIQRLESRDIFVDVTEELKKHIAKKGFDPAYGARPLRRAIQTLIEDKLAEEILEGDFDKTKPIKISAKDEQIMVNKK
jgi:ATP-dependent Clp protease ATP-binding subunit ClpC